MSKYLLITLIAIVPLVAHTQPDGMRGERFEKIKTAREAFLKERLSLTPEESDAFFPVFWRYETSIRKSRRDFGPGRRSDQVLPENLAEEEALELLMLNRKRKQKIIALEYEAEDAYLKILSAKQVVMLHRAEREFKEKLLRRLREERRGGKRDSP